MQWIRAALIGGIAICCYLLLLEWDRRIPASSGLDTEPETAEPDLNRTEAPLPLTTRAPTPATPMDENSGLTGETVAVAEQPAPSVALKSDHLTMRIALEGGGIESIQLPRFPQRIDTPNLPIELMRRTGPDGPAHYYARIGLQRNDGSLLPLTFSPKGADTSTLTLSASTPEGLTIERVYHLEEDSYLLSIHETLTNTGSEPVSLVPYAAFYRNDTESDDAFFSPFFGTASYLGAAWGNSEDSYIKVDFEDMPQVPQEMPMSVGTPDGWIAMVRHYFVSAWIPQRGQEHLYQMLYLSRQKLYVAGLTSPAIQLEPGQSGSHSIRLYAGPKEQEVLQKLARGLDLTVDYGWLWWLGQPLFFVLKLFHDWVGNWGWAIVLLTVLIKLLIYPLSAAGFRSMARMKQLQPDLERLRERYGEDRRKMAEKTMELYKTKGVNPLGGCLPLLLPMPVFLALYWVLLESVELRHAPWIWWIDDLAARDPYFILPLLMGLSMFGSQMLSPPPATMDPVQRRMLQFMPLIFVVFCLWFPSGLVLYWFCNSLLTMAQQWWINRTIAQTG